jgi:predicted rRNA methylase YqxC with S4 and FtsJ domains
MDNVTRTSLTAVAVVMFWVGLVSTASAQTRAEAEAEIRTLQTNIANATKEISNRNVAIILADVGIALLEKILADEQQKANPDPKVVALANIELELAKLAKKKVVQEKQDWERFQRDQQQALAEWKEYLRQLGP